MGSGASTLSIVVKHGVHARLQRRVPRPLEAVLDVGRGERIAVVPLHARAELERPTSSGPVSFHSVARPGCSLPSGWRLDEVVEHVERDRGCRSTTCSCADRSNAMSPPWATTSSRFWVVWAWAGRAQRRGDRGGRAERGRALQEFTSRQLDSCGHLSGEGRVPPGISSAVEVGLFSYRRAVLSRVLRIRAGARIPDTMNQTADVVVIGGGANGTSTAFHLTLLGVRNVVLLERRQLAAGRHRQVGRARAHALHQRDRVAPGPREPEGLPQLRRDRRRRLRLRGRRLRAAGRPASTRRRWPATSRASSARHQHDA